MLLKHFLASEYVALSQQQRDYLQQQPWLGNIRQLQNFSYYFKTTLKLDGFFNDSTRENSGEVIDLLTLIKQNSAPGHGVGRAALLALCREGDVMVSDAWLRKELSRLQDAGYITIGRGRSGCQLTERGTRHLAGLE